MTLGTDITRREFLAPAAAAAAFTIVPRHVLGGPGYVAPSDKVALAQIGCGTEGTRELVTGLIQNQQIQIVAVCDPVKDGTNYLDWSKNGTRNTIRKLLEDPGYGESVDGVRSGRDQFQEVVERYYAKTRGLENYKIASHADFRELLDKEKGVDAVKIVTPDFSHAAIAIAAMKKGKHVAVHKPLANRMNEAKLVIETARQTKVATHLLAWGMSRDHDRLVARLKEGVIGPVREYHTWTNTPVWPVYTDLPADRPPIPEGFDWQLWLGPERDRPYHPCYTHMVFRSWYDFGGGCMADGALYTQWPLFVALDLGAPIAARAFCSHACNVVDHVANPVPNDFSFPAASTIQFQFAAHGEWPALDMFWYEGGMRPRIPELEAEDAPLPESGSMWVGDKGKIIGNRVFTAKGIEPLFPEDASAGGRRGGGAAGQTTYARGEEVWVQAIKGGPPSPGNILTAGPISETICLGAVASRAARQKSGVRVYPSAVKLHYDSASMKITNLSEANKYLTRDYRPGWEL
jgi:hypothetical protein